MGEQGVRTKVAMSKYLLFYRRRSIIFTWLISYLFILLIPISISGVIYVKTIDTLEAEINRANESILMQIQQEVDSKIRDIKRICYELTIDKKVIEAANLPEPVKDEDVYRFVNFARDLKIYKAGNEFLDGLYIYYKKSDTIWGPNARISLKEPNTATKYYLGMEYTEAKEFLHNVTSTSIKGVTSLDDRNKQLRSIVYAAPISDNSLEQNDIIAIIVIRETELLNNIDKNSAIANGEFVIINGNEDIIASSNSEPTSVGLVYKDLPKEKGIIHHRYDGKDNIFTFIDSQVLDWKYIMITPEKIFWEKANYIRNFTYISFLICMILAGFATYFLLKTNYSSISSLMRTIAEKLSIPVEKKNNEYAFIESVLTNTINENKEISGKLKQQNTIIRDNLIIKLLKGRYNESVAIYESLSAMDVNIDSGCFAVMAFYIDNYDEFAKMPASYNDDELKLVEFIICNVIEELINRDNYCYTVNVDDILTSLVSFKNLQGGREVEELLSVARDAQKFINENFNIYFTIAISNVHDSVSQIPTAYGECMEALEHRMVMGSGKIICYRDIMGNRNVNSGYSYYYPMLVEQQLINFIKAGDFNGATGIVEEVLKSNFEEGTRSIQLAKCVMFNLTGTILKTMNDLSAHYRSDILGELNPAERLLGCETVDEMVNEMSGILKRVCEYIQSEKRNESSNFFEKVRVFISNNYKDINLSVGAIGEYFDITPAYASKLFKEQTGESILDYMNKIRVEKSKELLSEMEYTIQGVADMVGYNDVKTFTRYFKRYEGITPGKFKEISQKK